MTASEMRQTFETAREQEISHGLQGVRVVPIVSALLKAAYELDNAITLLDRVYREVGNSSPGFQRHALAPGLRDDIRDLLEKHKCPSID